MTASPETTAAIRGSESEAFGDPVSEVSLQSLPIFTPADQAKYGVTRLMVNMVKPKNALHPYAFAYINELKVFEGQRISGTRLRVFRIEQNGVGIEAEDTGSRYFLKY